MRSGLVLLGLGWLGTITALAQPNWKACGRGTLNHLEVQTLFGDSVSNRLLAGGTFMYILNESDTVLCVGQAAWDGMRWDSLAHRIQPIGGGSAQQTFWFLRFQDELYSCGGYTFMTDQGTWNTSFARLNEATQRWEALECINPAMSGLNTLVQKTPGATSMYATGYSESLCGYPEACVYRYDGSAFHEWEPWSLIPDFSSNYVAYVFDFQGLTYMNGVFANPIGTGYRYFMRYNGTAWEEVPGWGNAYHIRDVLIHDDVLYVCGTFKQSTGAPGNLVAAFDGETWNDLDGGLSLQAMPGGSTAWRMKWHNNHLYVGGVFDHAGGQQLNGGLAIWNGSQWSGLPGAFRTPHPNDPDIAMLRDLAFWRDSLYICGGFDQIDGQPINQVAQYLGALPGGGTGIGASPQGGSALSCSTIDGGTTWVADLPDAHPWRLDILNALGQTVLTLPAVRLRTTFSLPRAGPAVYFVHATRERDRRSAKILVR
jgi:hypothetical protein